MNKKKEAVKPKATLLVEEKEENFRDLIGENLMKSWQEGHKTVELLLDGVMNVLKDREISDKIPAFSVISTIATIKSSINFKDF